MKLIKKYQKGSKINKPVNFEKLDHYKRVGLYGDDYHERAQKFLGVEDPKSYLLTLDKWNWEKKVIPEINRYHENNPDAKWGPIDKIERIEDEIHNKHNKDVIMEIQKRLKEIGVYDGQIDGIWGPKSKKAKDDYHRLIGTLDSEISNLRQAPTVDNTYKYTPLFSSKK